MTGNDEMPFSECEDEETGRTEDSDGTGKGNDLSKSLKDEQWINRSRGFIVTFLVVAAGVVGVIAYRLSSHQQAHQFEQDVSSEVWAFLYIKAEDITFSRFLSQYSTRACPKKF
jgi:hypothetical protein